MGKLPLELQPCSAEDLPASPGVVAVLCTPPGDLKLLMACHDTENIRQTVGGKPPLWASELATHLSYLVFVSDDPVRRQLVLSAVEAFRKTGKSPDPHLLPIP
jgi:hypothetical protein